MSSLSLIVPHGHLKSSNVLLNESFEPLLTDYGLVPVVNQEHAQDIIVAYKSPEYKQNGRITKKTDLWSFGILILEILTGKFPANYLQQGKGSDTNTDTDLVTWVHSVVHEDNKCTSEVFDKDMGATKNSEGEMLKLLKIGLACAQTDVEKRCDLKEAVEKIEDLKDKDTDEDFYSSYTSDGDVKSARGLSDDFSFSMNG
ncbi:Pollen receptor-like kinase 1 [Camellia lanceoleosa]|uniref:Pollen receptor-like kinase 1 n=1 Tax=Camellia lanceoleosa TaxID=1840588 RepID=A0ACC0FIQ5_9ERIC|nr:Pollen receptor-like kinase 1 [Camellia lanceoleosa]